MFSAVESVAGGCGGGLPVLEDRGGVRGRGPCKITDSRHVLIMSQYPTIFIRV